MHEASPQSAVVSVAAKATVPTSAGVAGFGWFGIPLEHWQIFLGMFGVLVFVICTIVDTITKRRQANTEERRLRLLEEREERIVAHEEEDSNGKPAD